MYLSKTSDQSELLNKKINNILIIILFYHREEAFSNRKIGDPYKMEVWNDQNKTLMYSLCKYFCKYLAGTSFFGFAHLVCVKALVLRIPKCLDRPRSFLWSKFWLERTVLVEASRVIWKITSIWLMFTFKECVLYWNKPSFYS